MKCPFFMTHQVYKIYMILGDLANAIRENTDIKFGLYHSLYEWFNPLYLMDKANHYKTQKFVFGKTLPELYEIVSAKYYCKSTLCNSFHFRSLNITFRISKL